MKKAISLALCFVFCLSLFSCGGGGSKEALSNFYDKVKESQGLLDTVADDIYEHWYDVIYNDMYNNDVSTGVLMAQIENADNLNKIEELDAEINELFKVVKADPTNAQLAKEIMSAYSDYYEFVVNMSGSFNSFSADKETLKKELASLLKELSYEL